MPSFRLTALVFSAALLLGGCNCGPGLPDAGAAPDAAVPVGDAGVPPRPPDAGPVPDAGPSYSGNFPGEACPPELFRALDGGGVGPVVQFGLCVALRTVTGIATLNGKPAPSDIELEFEASDSRSDISRMPDGTGLYEAKVMRMRYDAFRYHPSGIFPTHQGPEEFGVIDLRQDKAKDLAVKSWTVRGNLSFAGVPWASTTQPPDLQLGALGLPPFQGVAATSQSGTYEVALLEGTFALAVSVPRTALGETEIIGWPVSLATFLTSDANIDIHIPASALSGQFTLDGQPFPNRRPGAEYALEFISPGARSPVARSVHEGGTGEFQAMLPRDRYLVLMQWEYMADRRLPSFLYNLQVTTGFDLRTDATLNIALNTFNIEGALGIDGVPVRPVPNFNFSLYTWAYDSGSRPWFMAYYDVPLDGPTFSIRALPSTYYVALYIDEHFRPDLVEGWFVVDPQYQLVKDTRMPIDIWTSPLEGRLTVDGKPPPVGKVAGILTLASATDGTYRKTLLTEEDGSFHLRVPRGDYDLYFQIDRSTYPEYATGRQLMALGVPLQTAQVVDLEYNTVAVGGPLRVGGEEVPDTLPGADEVGLTLRRMGDGTYFQWGFGGGRPDYLLRVPKGRYGLSFQIEEEALPGVAHGHAPLGVNLLLE